LYIIGATMDSNGLFSHVNDSIRRLAPEDQANEAWDFFCECPDTRCHQLVALTVLEFDEHRRASPPRPILATAHAGWSRGD
jgi:hypothetical protein